MVSSPRCGDHLAGHADVITEVDIMPPVSEHVGSNGIQSDHDLQVAGAVAQRGEAELATIPTENDTSGDRDATTSTRIGREFAGLRSDLRQGVGRGKSPDTGPCPAARSRSNFSRRTHLLWQALN